MRLLIVLPVSCIFGIFLMSSTALKVNNANKQSWSWYYGALWQCDSFYAQAQSEEGEAATGPPNPPYLLKWPRSFVKQMDSLNEQLPIKTRKFNFIGELDNSRAPFRKWIKPFALAQFKDNDFFVDLQTMETESHDTLGPWDHSKTFKAERMNIPFVPATFDSKYNKILAESEFTLCPRGDMPWSYRFIEAIFAKSIPIVENDADANGEYHEDGDKFNISSPQIGFKYYVKSDDPNFNYVYNKTWAEENYQKAILHHTLMIQRGTSGGNGNDLGKTSQLLHVPQEGNCTGSAKIPALLHITAPFDANSSDAGDLKRQFSNSTYIPKHMEVRYYSDEGMEKSVACIGKELSDKGLLNGVYETWKTIRPGAWRADLFRYLILWKMGGVYLDADIQLNDHLDKFVNLEKDCLVTVDDDAGWALMGGTTGYWQAMLAVSPHSPAMLDTIKHVVKNTQERQRDCMATTGPLAFYNAVHMYGHESKVKSMYRYTHWAGKKVFHKASGNVLGTKPDKAKQLISDHSSEPHYMELCEMLAVNNTEVPMLYKPFLLWNKMSSYWSSITKAHSMDGLYHTVGSPESQIHRDLLEQCEP